MANKLNSYLDKFSWKSHLNQFIETKLCQKKSFKDIYQSASQLKCPDNPGQYISVQCEDALITVTAVLSLWLQGKTPVLLSPSLKSNEVEQLKKSCPFETIEWQHEDIGSYQAFNSENEALVVFSSGSTGLSKGVVHSFRSLFASALGTIDFYKIAEGDKWCLKLPMNHLGGFMIFVRCFLSGAELTKDLKNSTFVSLVPTQLKRFVDDHSSFTSLKKKKAIILGGAPLGNNEFDEYVQMGLNISQTYGMTETSSHVWCTYINTPEGSVLPNRKMNVSEDDRIQVGGDILFKGYFEDGILHKPKLDKGFYTTNDLGDFFGNILVIKGRVDNVFISGGENIQPLEVSQLAISHEGIDNAYLVPVKDEEYGQVGFLFYEGPHKIAEDEIKYYLKNKLSDHKIPKYFYHLDEKLPQGQIKRKQSDLEQLAQTLMKE